ncbi:unnamed protein product [Prorocentrum cordatum]|uniref:DDHD domain-containing protein n=1 Tax=Prorocentrum cordatum TaxID=2364126 RepID=A0ABN9UR52_9DINO|nr:unnamed protein product [Polarella glacialis]
MASEDMRITEAANSDGRDLKFPRAMEKGDGKGGNGNSDVSRLFDMLTNIQHGQAALATKEDILGVKASQAEHDTQLAAMSERIADLEVKAQSSHAEAVAAANAEVQRAITVSIEQVKNDAVHNFQSAYSIIFDSNSNAKGFLTRARTLGVTWDDPTNRATIKLKIRMDAPPEIRKVNRVLGIRWSKVMDVARNTNKWNDSYKLGAQGFREKLWLISGDETAELFEVKGSDSGQMDIMPNTDELKKLGFTDAVIASTVDGILLTLSGLIEMSMRYQVEFDGGVVNAGVVFTALYSTTMHMQHKQSIFIVTLGYRFGVGVSNWTECGMLFCRERSVQYLFVETLTSQLLAKAAVSYQVEQPQFTHRVEESVEGRTAAKSLARLDRICTRIPTGVLLDFAPFSGVLGRPADPSTLSDHVPVHVVLAPKCPDGILAVKSWVTKHPMFPKVLGEILEGAGPLSGNPMEAVEEVRGGIQAASRKVLGILEQRGAHSLPEYVSWALATMRAERSGSQSVLRRAVKAYPRLLQFFDVESCRFSDFVGFHHLLASLKRQQIDGQIELVQNDPDMSQSRKQQKTNTLYTYRFALTARGASISLQAIADPLGAPIFDPREAFADDVGLGPGDIVIAFFLGMSVWALAGPGFRLYVNLGKTVVFLLGMSQADFLAALGYHGHHWDQHGRGSNGGASWREGHGDRHDWGPAPPWPGSGRGGALHGDDIGEGQERVFGEQRVACLTSDQLVLEDRYKRLSYHLHSVVDEADAGKECDTCCLVVFLHGMGQSEWRLGEHEVRCGIHRRLRAAAPDDWRGNQTMRTLILELSLHSKSPTWVAGWACGPVTGTRRAPGRPTRTTTGAFWTC